MLIEILGFFTTYVFLRSCSQPFCSRQQLILRFSWWSGGSFPSTSWIRSLRCWALSVWIGSEHWTMQVDFSMNFQWFFLRVFEAVLSHRRVLSLKIANPLLRLRGWKLSPVKHIVCFAGVARSLSVILISVSFFKQIWISGHLYGTLVLLIKCLLLKLCCNGSVHFAQLKVRILNDLNIVYNVRALSMLDFVALLIFEVLGVRLFQAILQLRFLGEYSLYWACVGLTTKCHLGLC